MAFITDRRLLNPKFEGYKLASFPDNLVQRYDLPYLPTQAGVSGRSRVPLSFEEVESRITHNHLAVDAENSVALYVDEHLQVIKICIHPEALIPSIRVLVELPQSIGFDEDQHKDYPSLVNVRGDYWLVSDGFGQLYGLVLREDEGRIIGPYSLPEDNGTVSPFKIQKAHLASDGTTYCLLSYPLRQADTPTSHTQRTRFELLLVSLPSQGTADDLQTLSIIWRGTGDDVPVYSFYDPTRASFCALGTASYQNAERRTFSYQPTDDEMAPIPRANEKLEGAPSKPTLYSWTQSPDAVTVAFPVPSYILKSAFKIAFSATTLTLHIDSEMSHSVPLPRYSMKRLWDGISPTSSFWTWDKEGDRQFGILTLHIEKQHEGTRWPHLFLQSANTPESHDDDISETLDPSELWLIRESLEKYTSALQTGEDASGLGLGRGVPSLADGEVDDEVDASVGKSVCLTWVNIYGDKPEGSSEQEITPVTLLSAPLPGTEKTKSLVIKSSIDGLLFSLPDVEQLGTNTLQWVHTSTFSALAFVLASKRDIRFTYHIESQAVLAFESGSSMGGGNVFIYHKTGISSVSARQSVLKITNDSTGPLLGAGAVVAKSGVIIMCLCERKLVVFPADKLV